MPSMIRRRSVGVPALAVLVLIGLAGCEAESPGTTTQSAPPAIKPASPPAPKSSAKVARAANPAIPQDPSPFRFRDRAKEAGIDFVHVSGMTEERHFPSANGSGLAVFDADGDGKMDLYFATCTLLPVGSVQKGPNRLYRNKGDGTFEDITAKSGLGFRGFCHGIVVGDLDNDGDQDVLLCNYGPNVLYLNNGDGTFKDVSKAAGIDRGAPDKNNWTSGGAVLDFDGDGDLDVYATNYGEWLLERDNKNCTPNGKVRQYCSPKEVRTVKHHLYRNDGLKDGVPHFTDVIDEFLVDEDGKKIPGRADGHGFGAVAADLNDDGLIDLYIANDQNPAFLFLNRGDGTFTDATESSGAAYDERGNAQSGMGVDAQDLDGDGLPELFRTNFKDETNTLYQNLGKGMFYDQTPAWGVGPDSMPWVGWGCILEDLDNDGWPDCFVTNGHVDNNYDQLGQDIPYAEPALLHRNVASRHFQGKGKAGSRTFQLSTRGVGPYFEAPHVGRGATFGDLNDDGRMDLIVSHKDGPPALLSNETPGPNRWIRLVLRGTTCNRDAIGAKVAVVVGGRTIDRQQRGGVSMESSHDPRLLIGVGPAEAVESVTIEWPRPRTSKTVLKGVKTNQTITVVEPAPGPDSRPAK